MKYADTFSSFHPTVAFLYYALVFAISMCVNNPLYIIISLAASVMYSIYLKGRRAAAFSLKFLLPMMLLAAILNPAFNHEGATILTYLPSGNILTLESIVYGAFAACMLAAVIMWFASFNEIITSDKFVYLFGRIIPALSLILSMTLRFVPRFVSQMKIVSEAQKCLGCDVSQGSVPSRIKKAVRILSIMITWSLENAVDTADSMRSRGYGLPGRTAFSIYRFDDRDKSALLWLFFCGIYIFTGKIAGCLQFRYYPTIKWAEITPVSVSFALVFLFLCLTPLAIDIREDITWKSLESTI